MITDANNPQVDQIEMLIRRMLRSINTAIPGIIVSFNAETQTAKIQPAIKSLKRQSDDSIKPASMPELLEVPVVFLRGLGSGFSVTVPIKAGDECLVVFSQRSIDNWWTSGKESEPVEPVVPRTHDLSDGIAIVGLTSKPNAIADFQTDCIEIRNSDRSTRVSVYDDRVEVDKGGTLFKVSDSEIEMDATTVKINGNLELTGDMQQTGDLERTGDSVTTGNVENTGTLKNNAVGVGSVHTHNIITPVPGSPTTPPMA